MVSKMEYLDFVHEQLDLLDNITYRSMMGEFLLYYHQVLIGGIYDDRLLIKIVKENKKYEMKETIPYPGAKPMHLASEIDDKELLKDVVLDTYKCLRK